MCVCVFNLVSMVVNDSILLSERPAGKSRIEPVMCCVTLSELLNLLASLDFLIYKIVITQISSKDYFEDYIKGSSERASHSVTR